MAERILKFGGIDAISRTESEKGDAEPDTDPRGTKGTAIVGGMHLMSAVEQLQPATTTRMAYFDPDSGAAGRSLDDIERAIREEEMSLEEVMTATERFTPLVNPRRSREKQTGERPPDSDGDLWHVPTKNYQAMPPRTIFTPLASVVDNSDAVSNSGVFGEFRERRNGGEVMGEVWFEDFEVGAIEGDPVRLGFKVGWNYFGDRAFFYQPFAQQTRCKNSVAPLDDKQTVMHHNKSINFHEVWEEALAEMDLYTDELTQYIQTARDLLFDFSGELDEDTDHDDVIPVPMDLESFYAHTGFPDQRIPADHAREEAEASSDPREGMQRINAWHLHAGATYWLSWHWNGSEDSRNFREYRRAANDMLFNPNQIIGRVEREYAESERERIIRDVTGTTSLEGASEEERQEVEDRMMDHDGIATIQASAESVQDMVEQFEDTEERLDRMQQAISGE